MPYVLADIDTIDNTLGGWILVISGTHIHLTALMHEDSLRMFMSTLANIVGAIILIAIVLPWFLIAVFALSACYLWAAFFYRASARELKVRLLPWYLSVVLTTRLSPATW